jgi:large subunit ribosomal protein L6
MSRIGKLPVTIPSGVKVALAGRTVTVQGKDATLTFEHRPEVSVKIDGDQIIVERQDDSKPARKLHGTTRAILQNMVVGVTEGYRKVLQINGVGWNARVQGRSIVLVVGYANPRELAIPMGVDVAVDGNRITVSGADKQAVGEMAARIRAQRKPEPYNHKGIKYADEVLTKKEGKAFAGGGA